MTSHQHAVLTDHADSLITVEATVFSVVYLLQALTLAQEHPDYEPAMRQVVDTFRAVTQRELRAIHPTLATLTTP